MEFVFFLQSWSSSEDWTRQHVGIREPSYLLQQENIELMKQVYTWKAKYETLQ